MARNNELGVAKTAKKDEFYTVYETKIKEVTYAVYQFFGRRSTDCGIDRRN